MKIIQVVPSLDYGGLESHRLLIAKYSTTKDVNLSFMCLGDTGRTGKKIEALGFDVNCMHENVRIPNVRLILKLYQYFRSEKPDVVHSCAAEANFHSMIAAFLARVPVRIAEEIGIPRQSTKAKAVFRVIYKISTAVIGVSRRVQEYLITENKVKPEKTKLIYNPYDIDLYKKAGKRKKRDGDNIKIISVGRLVEEKNHAFLIDAFAIIHTRYPHSSLEIIGDGPLKESLGNKIIALGMQQHITLEGYKEDIHSYLEDSDMFILPSKSEGLGIALIEAMAMGKLVIGTDAGGIPEVIDAKKPTGWIVQTDNIENMVETIEKVIKLPVDEKNRIAANAKRHVEKLFSPYKYLENLETFYRDLLHVG